MTDTVGFAWLTGTWRHEEGDEVCDEWWSEAADTQFGAFRWRTGGKTRFLELFAIERTDAGIALRLRHFGPGMVPLEAEGPLEWRLAEARENEAVFENSALDFPRRVHYHRVGDTELACRIEGVSKDGEPRSHAFRFRYLPETEITDSTNR
jgi:hypothetical protein